MQHRLPYSSHLVVLQQDAEAQGVAGEPSSVPLLRQDASRESVREKALTGLLGHVGPYHLAQILILHELDAHAHVDVDAASQQRSSTACAMLLLMVEGCCDRAVVIADANAAANFLN
jgi:hypothetical protein